MEAVKHAREVMGAIRHLQTLNEDELYVYAKEIRAPVELVRQTKELGRLPVVNFAAGGVATPADAALMMQLGMDGVFVGSGAPSSQSVGGVRAPLYRAPSPFASYALPHRLALRPPHPFPDSPSRCQASSSQGIPSSAAVRLSRP